MKHLAHPLTVIGILASVCLLLSSGAPIAAQPTETVEADGVAVILKGNTDIARDTAIADAQRKAVEQAVGVLMSSESLVENYDLVSDRILTQSAGYIQSYTIIAEDQTDTEYRVTIQAVIGTGSLDADLQAIQHLIRQKGNPRMMLLVEETIEGATQAGIGSGGISQAETRLSQAFLDAGFEVVDSATVTANINRDQALKAVEGDAAAAAALGNQYGADVIITATAAASAGEKILNTSMKSHQAAITAKVVRADTGAVITTVTEQAKQAHIDDLTGGAAAIEKAAQQLADTLIPRILEQWRQEIQTATTIQLMVSNVSFAQLRTLKAVLSDEIRGVQEVYQRSFQANTARLDVEIQSTTEQLAEELFAKEFEAFSLDITGMSENRIDLTIQAK